MSDVVKEAEKVINPKLAPNILAKIKMMQAEVQKADTLLKVYMAGVMDAMGLEGNFRINDITGEITPVKEGEKDGKTHPA